MSNIFCAVYLKESNECLAYFNSYYCAMRFIDGMLNTGAFTCDQFKIVQLQQNEKTA